MRFVFFVVIAICLMTQPSAQTNQKEVIYKTPAEVKQETINFLLGELKRANNDQTRLRIMDSLSMYYLYYSTQTDSSLFYSNISITTAFPLEDKRYLILAYARRANYFWQKTNLKAALESSFQGIQLSKDLGILDYLSTHYNNIISIYGQYANHEQLMINTASQLKYLEYSKDPFFDQRLASLLNTGYMYQVQKKDDSAFFYFTKAYETSQGSKDPIHRDKSLWNLGGFYSKVKKHGIADSILLEGVKQAKSNFDNQVLDAIYWELANNYLSSKQYTKAIIAAHFSLDISQMIRDYFSTLLATKLLSTCYDSLGMTDSTLHFLRLTTKLNDSLFNATNISEMQEVTFSDHIKQKEKQANEVLAKEKDRNKLRLYGFITAISVFLFVGLIMWQNSRQRKKAYILLQNQKEETDKQKAKVEQTLEELKSTQSQLIHSEKMASLGELTAGIAHEIQNPLNFVNNFSEVNMELLNELKDGPLKKLPEEDKKEAHEIVEDLSRNLQKINHHGKRADAIVKGMLQHSRSSSGIQEAIDINALADEYLRLAYHGLRAKDKDFNAIMKTHFDETIGNINIVPQDIGRVLLNLYTNAFYAVTDAATGSAPDYKPTVSVSTKKIRDKIEIRVGDNGNGIPQKVIDKIFQPFFTTKPTGQGTGLGLSLSYDIVKAHSGEIKVETKENEGTEFIIQLPFA